MVLIGFSVIVGVTIIFPVSADLSYDINKYSGPPWCLKFTMDTTKSRIVVDQRNFGLDSMKCIAKSSFAIPNLRFMKLHPNLKTTFDKLPYGLESKYFGKQSKKNSAKAYLSTHKLTSQHSGMYQCVAKLPRFTLLDDCRLVPVQTTKTMNNSLNVKQLKCRRKRSTCGVVGRDLINTDIHIGKSVSIAWVVSITVYKRPEFLNTPSYRHISTNHARGSWTTLNCSAVGYPKPRLDWVVNHDPHPINPRDSWPPYRLGLVPKRFPAYQYREPQLTAQIRSNSFLNDQGLWEVKSKMTLGPLYDGMQVKCIARNIHGTFVEESKFDYTLMIDRLNCSSGNPLEACVHGYCEVTEYVITMTECICDEGWDGRNCNVDIDECKYLSSGCSHICTNMVGSYRCRCPPHLDLDDNGKNCVPPEPLVAPLCGPYYPNGVCSDVIDVETSVYLGPTLLETETRLKNVTEQLRDVPSVASPECLTLLRRLLCHLELPECSAEEPAPRTCCPSDCDALRLGPCAELYKRLKLHHPETLKGCETNPTDDERQSPCSVLNPYYPRVNATGIGSECLLEGGEFYNGKVNVTETGKKCVFWKDVSISTNNSSAALGGIDHLSYVHVILVDHSNYCRNPGKHRATPWCYTDPAGTQWESCTIPECPTTQRSRKSSETTNPDTDIAVTSSMGLVAFIFFLATILLYRYRNRVHLLLLQLPRTPHEYGIWRSIVSRASSNNTQGVPSDLCRFVIPRKLLVKGNQLGVGAFGVVYAAKIYGVKVAVKMVLEESSRIDANHEALLLSKFQHVNVVTLVAVCMDATPYCIIMERAKLGDLGNQITQCDGLPLRVSVHAAVQVAVGLEYVHGHRIVHRDICTRNCVVRSRNQAGYLHVQIADFGLSKYIDEGIEFYARDGFEPFNVRFSAPEVLRQGDGRTYFASDWWSFAVFLWEVLSGCSVPYAGLSNAEVMDAVGSNQRIPRSLDTEQCPGRLWRLMLACWNADIGGRPTAGEIIDELKEIRYLIDNPQPVETIVEDVNENGDEYIEIV